MSANREDSPSSGPQRRARRFLGRWWNCREYVVYYKSLAGAGRPAEVADDRVRFFVAQPSDIPWMSPHLGAWASWCRGGKETPGAEPVLREQFVGDDFTIAGAENKPGGALVFVLHVSHDDFSLALLGDAFVPSREVTLRRGWVSPDHRRQGVATGGLLFAEAEAARRGLTGIWNYVETRNAASRAMHLKCGYEDRGRARWLTRFGLRYASIRLDPAEKWQTRRIPRAMTGL